MRKMLKVVAISQLLREISDSESVIELGFTREAGCMQQGERVRKTSWLILP